MRIRLRPDYEGLDQPSDFGYEGESVRDLARRYKPGIATETLLAHGATFLDAPDLELTGVMVHLGRHRADLPTWKAMVDSVVEVLGKISRAWGGWEPTEIDLGGGFATPRDPTGRLTPRGHARPPGDQAPTIEEYAGVLTSHLRSGLAREHLQARGKTLEVEPGRSLFADAGVHLTRVRHLKSERRPEARRWVETDTTEMFLLDSLVEHARWTPVVVRQPDRPATQTADLVGISCGFDIIVPDAHLPEVEVGDVIAFLDTGAYQEACANNFNALPRPGTVLVRGRESEWIKVPETVGDVFRRDRLPARLGSNPDGGPR